MCNVTLSSKCNLDSHMIGHDPQLAKYNCHICSKGFAQKSRLHEHLKVHNQFYKCSVPGCNKHLGSKHNLINHINKCAKGETLPCSACKKTFYSNASLRQHKRIVHRLNLSKSSERTNSSVDTTMSNNETGYFSGIGYGTD